MCVVYLLDSQFIIDAPKYISGCLVRMLAERLPRQRRTHARSRLRSPRCSKWSCRT